MKITNTLFICAILFTQTVFCQITQPVYQIAKWFDDKKAALSVNFDDNLPGQFNTALPIMNAKGVKGTFYVITNTASSQWAVLQSAIDGGHEVGSHSVSHPTDLNFPSIAQPQKEIQIEAELKNSHDAILANLTGQTSLSISWPFGKGGGGNDSIVRRVAKKYYFAARNTTAGNTNGDAYTHYANTWFSAFGRDYYLQSGGILMASTTTKANIGTFITEIIKTNGWFSPYYHAVNQVGGYNNVTTEVFQQHMDTIASQSNDVWITTFGNASKYHRQRNSGGVNLVATAEDNISWTLNLTDNLDNNTFNQPLTVLLNEPTFGVKSITQNGNNLPFTISLGIVKFNAIPDGGQIVIGKNNVASSIDNMQTKKTALINESESFVLNINDATGKYGRIILYDALGREIQRVFDGLFQSDEQQFRIQKQTLPQGCLMLKIQGNVNASYKLLKK